MPARESLPRLAAAAPALPLAYTGAGTHTCGWGARRRSTDSEANTAMPAASQPLIP
jgi:hypothetical protein